MNTLCYPDLIVHNEKLNGINPNLFFYNYKANRESEKNKVLFTKNIFNFIISGHKVIHTMNQCYEISNGQGILICNGNCLTSEKFTDNTEFQSLTLYFDTSILERFLLKHPEYSVQQANQVNDHHTDLFVFNIDPFILNYIHSAQQIIAQQHQLPIEFNTIKFEEILLYLIHKEGSAFVEFINTMLVNRQEIDFKAKIESELMNNLTLEEMAFLCNMSLSTFKRHFTKWYGMSPQKWFQNQRLRLAHELLRNNSKNPSDLYLELGYSSLSSFSTAFSKMYGYPPTRLFEN